jgi:ribose transport system ATP-binding protein
MDEITRIHSGSTTAGDGGAATLPRLQAAGVSKTFGRQRVLQDFRIQIAAGELHALVGQNGSGKSTFAKILTGVYTADSGGSIQVDGTELGTRVRVPQMREVGLSVVHQSLGLIDDATVVENVRAGRHRAARFSRRIDWDHERAEVAAVLERLGASLDLDTRVDRLTAEDRATVAIARAFQDQTPGRGLIIFDESTRALTSDALGRFYEMVNAVRRAGAAALLICHRLEEVIEVSDRVTVLKDGRVTGEGIETRTINEGNLVKLMLGRDLRRRKSHKDDGPASAPSPPETAVTVQELSGTVLADLSFAVGRGEVLGFTGRVGSGFEEIPYLLAGAQRARSGSLTVNGSSFRLGTRGAGIAELAAVGVAFVPEKRAEEGLALDETLAQNITLPRLTRHGSRWWIGEQWQRDEAARMIERLGITPPNPDAILGTFSGGNQQKVLLGKWLAGRPELLLLQEPTQAVDVGAREDIIDAVREVAAEGCPVIVAGSDPGELAAICDRVIILSDGAYSSELSGHIHPDAIVHATFGQPVPSG